MRMRNHHHASLSEASSSSMYIPYLARNILVVFTVTCLEKMVGRSGFYSVFFFFFSTQMHVYGCFSSTDFVSKKRKSKSKITDCLCELYIFCTFDVWSLVLVNNETKFTVGFLDTIGRRVTVNTHIFCFRLSEQQRLWLTYGRLSLCCSSFSLVSAQILHASFNYTAEYRIDNSCEWTAKTKGCISNKKLNIWTNNVNWVQNVLMDEC